MLEKSRSYFVIKLFAFSDFHQNIRSFCLVIKVNFISIFILSTVERIQQKWCFFFRHNWWFINFVEQLYEIIHWFSFLWFASLTVYFLVNFLKSKAQDMFSFFHLFFFLLLFWQISQTMDNFFYYCFAGRFDNWFRMSPNPLKNRLTDRIFIFFFRCVRLLFFFFLLLFFIICFSII